MQVASHRFDVVITDSTKPVVLAPAAMQNVAADATGSKTIEFMVTQVSESHEVMREPLMHTGCLAAHTQSYKTVL